MSLIKRVTDHTKTLGTLEFFVWVSVVIGGEHSLSESEYLHPLSFSVPHGYREQAIGLARRYRLEIAGAKN